jgi:ankyrin repeat protein
VQLLHRLGADVNEVEQADGWTPAHIASAMGHVAVVHYLGAHGADLNARDGDRGWTPAHRASDNGHLQVIQELTALGADMNAVDDEGMTPAQVVQATVLPGVPPAEQPTRQPA